MVTRDQLGMSELDGLRADNKRLKALLEADRLKEENKAMRKQLRKKGIHILPDNPVDNPLTICKA